MSCPDCFSGSTRESVALRGTVSTIHSLKTYISEPTSGRPIRGIIVIIPDAFGFDFVNNHVLADHYAEKGDYRVYLPDFMLGYSAPLWLLDTMKELQTGKNILTKSLHILWAIYGVVPWILRNRIGRSYPIVEKFFCELRKSEGAELPIGVAGFCWGGKHALLLAQDAKVDGLTLIDAAFTGHPSMVKLPDDIVNLKQPVSFAIGDKDTQITVEKTREVEALLAQFPDDQDSELRIYGDTGHGFCVRADITAGESESAKRAGEAED